MGRGSARTGLGQRGTENPPLVNGVYIVEPQGHNVKGEFRANGEHVKSTEGRDVMRSGLKGFTLEKRENITKAKD
jgi:hypothetical protein